MPATKLPATRWIFNLGTSATLGLIIVVLFAFLSFTTRSFLTWENLVNLLRQTSINGVIALGMLVVIITAGIDLSVGAVVAIAGIVNALLLKEGVPLVATVRLILCSVSFCRRRRWAGTRPPSAGRSTCWGRWGS